MLHLKVPEVMRIAAKCAKVYLKKVSLLEIKMLRSIDDADEKSKSAVENSDFISRALQTIGIKLTNSESHSTEASSGDDSEANSSKPNKDGPKEEAKAEIEV